MRNRIRCAALLGALGLGWAVPAAHSQVAGTPAPERSQLSGVSHVLVPQVRGWSLQPGRQPIQVRWMRAQVEVLELAARTTLEFQVANPGGQQAEAVLLLPVPAGSAVSGFAFSGEATAGQTGTVQLLPRDEARRTYDEIVRRIQDPALLEFAGSNLVRSSVFPVPAGGTQTVRLTYEHLLEVDGPRRDYVLQRSESLDQRVPCAIEVVLKSQKPISMVYSPTHDLEVLDRDPHRSRVRVRKEAEATPGPFRLSHLVAGDGLGASLIASPDPHGNGGYFLLMGGLPETSSAELESVKRDVTVVLDRSGSMAGEKMDQARAAALQVVEGLKDGEAFNIIDYSSRVSLFAPAPVTKDREQVLAARAYLDALRPTGGTNIHDALQAALTQPTREGYLGLVLFLTDGLPTVGRTLETEIRETVQHENLGKRRVFTFGVGHDVNVPLLDTLSDSTRGTSTFVLPGEDVEVKVAQVFRRLYGPVLSDLELVTLDASGAETTRAVREALPERLPDLFDGDQLIVLGRYLGDEPLRFRLEGRLLGEPTTFRFDLGVDKASARNAFVARLWAARKIAFLVDQIRQAGARDGATPLELGANLFSDPRYAELAEEILRLSTEFGILSEYTSFLATEGTDLTAWDGLILACNGELDRRAVRTRFGEAAVSQGRNFNDRKVQVSLNLDNQYWNDRNELVQFAAVRQISDRAFFQRDGQWIDSQLIYEQQDFLPEETVLFGSAEHSALLATLAAEGRQGLLSLPGEILLFHGGKRVLVQNGQQ